MSEEFATRLFKQVEVARIIHMVTHRTEGVGNTHFETKNLSRHGRMILRPALRANVEARMGSKD
jgi:hypothetical protein